ncbi:MAG TPA: VOC family protein [Rhizomicrobium sp.]|nr:VOC family protein [Rhizomicrobium sp.]
MQIKLAAVTVENQEAALQFYTGRLGFTKKADISMGPYRWLTVSSPDGLEGVELLLEAAAFPPSHVYQKARYDAGIPSTAFFTSDIASEFKRLKDAGVSFRSEPRNTGPAISAVFDDTCGNLINLVQPPA